jgi:hypothetical protein
MEAAVAQALCRERVDGRRRDCRPVTAEIGESDIVEKNDQDIRRAGRWLGRLRPPWQRILDRFANLDRKRIACSHEQLTCFFVTFSVPVSASHSVHSEEALAAAGPPDGTKEYD